MRGSIAKDISVCVCVGGGGGEGGILMGKGGGLAKPLSSVRDVSCQCFGKIP